jgi:hypothetical protein
LTPTLSSGPSSSPKSGGRRERLTELLSECHGDFDLFNSAVLGRPPYWQGQIDICDSVRDYRTTLVKAGNLVGKTFALAGILLAWEYTRGQAITISTAPSQTQLEEVLWKEVRSAWKESLIPLAGRLLAQPQKLEIGDKHFALGYSTTKTERLSGHHTDNLLAIVDEGSGIEPQIYEALDSLNAQRVLIVGNPLRSDGVFYERCQAAAGNPLTNLLRIPSTDSPDIHLERSRRGLADKTWLDAARNDYGEGSLWWKTHVLAEFPDSSIESVIPGSWLDLAARTIHRPAGLPRIAIDLAKGTGGDRSVVLCRDDNGVREIQHSRTWSLETTATQAALMAQRHGVPGYRVSFDSGGLGTDFRNRLDAVGLTGSHAYLGDMPGGTKCFNLRAAAAWALRQRLDPNRMQPASANGAVMVPQIPFALSPAHVALCRRELQALRYDQDPRGRIKLEAKEIMVKALKCSPDFADVLGQSFAFPDM